MSHQETRGVLGSSRPRPCAFPRTTNYYIKQSHSKEQNRTACWFSSRPLRYACRMRAAWSSTCPGHVSCKSHCEAGTVRLRVGIPLCGSSKLTWHSLPSSPAQESPTAVPPIGQLVLRGALANNNPALTSGAQKTCSQDSHEDIPRKNWTLLPDPLVCNPGPQLYLVWQRRGCNSKNGVPGLLSGCVQGPDPNRWGLAFHHIVQSQPPACTHRGRLVLQTAPLQQCHTLQKNSQRSGGGWLFSSKGAIA